MLRDPSNTEKTGKKSVSVSKSEDNIEISSQTLKAIVPGVLPLSESELKLGDESDLDEQEESNSLGSLSDGELRERKLLLQEKLKGLEEGDGRSNGNQEAGKDPEEEERALRKAAQDSMKAKLAKKQDLKRRSTNRDEEKTEKKKMRKDKDQRQLSPPSQKRNKEEGNLTEISLVFT